MACEHNGPEELIAMAETWLRDHSVAEPEWPGRKFRWTENVEGGMWASVCLEVERRGPQWVVTRLDRSNTRAEEPGFLAL